MKRLGQAGAAFVTLCLLLTAGVATWCRRSRSSSPRRPGERKPVDVDIRLLDEHVGTYERKDNPGDLVRIYREGSQLHVANRATPGGALMASTGSATIGASA